MMISFLLFKTGDGVTMAVETIRNQDDEQQTGIGLNFDVKLM